MTLAAAAGLLACPACRAELDVSEAQAARCPNGHSYDVARQGYLNLLRGKPPANADTADMVSARERFLASAAYAPIAAALVVNTRGSQTLLEAGSGTGWYLARCLESLPAARGVGLDISVAAAKRAARANRRLAAIVADTWQPLPLRDGAFDTVLCVFAPRNPGEFARVLQPGGRLVIVTPQRDHLRELRDHYGLLDIEPDKALRLAASLEDAFVGEEQQEVRRELDLSADQVRDLIAMGPNAFHSVVAEPEATRVTLAVRVSTWRTR